MTGGRKSGQEARSMWHGDGRDSEYKKENQSRGIKTLHE